MFGELLVALVLAVPLIATVLLARTVFTLGLRENRASLEAILSEQREMVRRVLVVQSVSGGLNPHVADPSTFGPTGMAREDEAKVKADAEQQRDAVYDAEAEDLREAEERYFAALRKAAEAPPGGPSHNAA